MTIRPTLSLLLPALVAGLLPACSKEGKPDAKPTASAAPAVSAAPSAPTRPALGAFAKLPERGAGADLGPAERVKLGRMLYFDARLSKNHDVSCNSCHDLARYGVDGEKTSPGHKKQRGGRNSPTVYNAALHFRQFWDGRAADVEEQATGPVMNPVEMAMPDEKRVVDTLSSMPEYVELFAKSFPGEKAPITLKNAGRAIGAFERLLVTPSRFDAYVGGRDDALSPAEVKGLVTFISSGCTACHNGAAIGGGSYQKLGLVKPWPDAKDEGREQVTKQASDRQMFKVPSLRNIDKTAPYFHDGSVASLETAVKLMAHHQLGRELSDADVASVVTFLKALTGELPKELITAPELPKSTAKTPKPDPR
ncbi:MAG: c-type cytochrome [Polyangiaceae bacterium]|nr:c-type cytochrome [Polyangiaceae bacterium]